MLGPGGMHWLGVQASLAPKSFPSGAELGSGWVGFAATLELPLLSRAGKQVSSCLCWPHPFKGNVLAFLPMTFHCISDRPLLMFCLILATVVCMSGQGGQYNFLRTAGLGLSRSLFLEA